VRLVGLATVVGITIARYQNRESKTDIKALLFKVITFTPFAVLMVSLLLPIAPLVTPVLGFLDWLGLMIVPATMMVGVWALFAVLSVDKIMTASVVFQSAAPPMITAAALLISARIAVPLVGSALGLGTILSFISLPLWGLLLN